MNFQLISTSQRQKHFSVFENTTGLVKDCLDLSRHRYCARCSLEKCSDVENEQEIAMKKVIAASVMSLTFGLVQLMDKDKK